MRYNLSHCASEALLGSVGLFECAVCGQRVRFSSESQEILKYLQAKESNNFSSYSNGSSNFLC